MARQHTYVCVLSTLGVSFLEPPRNAQNGMCIQYRAATTHPPPPTTPPPPKKIKTFICQSPPPWYEGGFLSLMSASCFRSFPSSLWCGECFPKLSAFCFWLKKIRYSFAAEIHSDLSPVLPPCVGGLRPPATRSVIANWPLHPLKIILYVPMSNNFGNCPSGQASDASRGCCW